MANLSIFQEMKHDAQSMYKSESSPFGCAGALLSAMRRRGQCARDSATLQRCQS
jgi:hypothetical protein